LTVLEINKTIEGNNFGKYIQKDEEKIVSSISNSPEPKIKNIELPNFEQPDPALNVIKT